MAATVVRQTGRFLAVHFDLPPCIERDLLVRKLFTAGLNATTVNASAFSSTGAMLKSIWAVGTSRADLGGASFANGADREITYGKSCNSSTIGTQAFGKDRGGAAVDCGLISSKKAKRCINAASAIRVIWRAAIACYSATPSGLTMLSSSSIRSCPSSCSYLQIGTVHLHTKRSSPTSWLLSRSLAARR